MAVDRTRLSQPTRLALLERFELETDRWREDNDVKVDTLTSRVDVMGAKLAVYSTLGALLGGGLVSGIVALIFK